MTVAAVADGTLDVRPSVNNGRTRLLVPFTPPSPLPADDDRRLIRAAVAGDQSAYSDLLNRHQDRIYSLVRLWTRDANDADDLAQETFIRAFGALGDFKGESTFRTWLYRIALNVVRTHHDRQHRRRSSWLPWSGSGHEQAPNLEDRVAATGDLEKSIIDRQLIGRALAELPDDLRAAVTLRDVHGLDYKEIAACLDIPIGTVESRIFRGRQRLRPLLQPLVERHRPTESPAARETSAPTPTVAVRPMEKSC
ncbi:MAG: sigma-70 family RNA polymerase sigma factor [Vicinamibacterales bacterium]